MNYLYLHILYKTDLFFQLELLVSYKQATKKKPYSLKSHQGVQNKRCFRNISRVSSDPNSNPFSSQFPKSMEEFIQPRRSGAHQYWRSAGISGTTSLGKIHRDYLFRKVPLICSPGCGGQSSSCALCESIPGNF